MLTFVFKGNDFEISYDTAVSYFPGERSIKFYGAAKEISKILGLQENTLKEYIEILEHVFRQREKPEILVALHQSDIIITLNYSDIDTALLAAEKILS